MQTVQPEQKVLSDWKKDFKEYINSLDIPRDDYNGIIQYIDEVSSSQIEIIHCKECEYGKQDDVGRWFCRGFGCQVGDE